jgi:chitosanase
VQRYTNAKPGNALAKFLRAPEIDEAFAANDYEPSTMSTAWRESSPRGSSAPPTAPSAPPRTPKSMATYYQPAMNRARTLGLTTALAKAQLYDAIIQHGDGSDHDGLTAMISRANSRTDGSPASGKDEADLAENFLAVRRETLMNATDPDTARPGPIRSIASPSTPRC